VVTDTYDYDAFGNMIAQTGSTTNESRYCGEQWDSALQMYYLRARYYLPRTGRFRTMDKVEGIDWKPATENAFSYAHVDPTDNIDPEGTLVAEYGQLAQRGLTFAQIALRGLAVATGVAVVVGTWPRFPQSELRIHAQGSDF